MLQSIYTVLEGLGLSSQKRALHLRFSNEILNSQVLIQRIEGRHWINEGLHAELLCLSTHPYIALKQFIGCQVAVDQVTDQGELFRTTGIITAAKQGHSDGALSVYQLTLEDATSLWHKRRNSRVFLNKSVKAISEILFAEWQKRSGLFAKSLSLDLSGLNREYDVRPLVIQSNESDYDFLTRLWRSEGINWLIDEKELIVSISAQNIQPQVLRLVDEQQYFQALKRRSIRFHRSHATEQIDSIKYYPYLKNIKISKPIKEKSIDMGDNAKPEIYRTMNEMINGKITGKYTFMSQGYLLYNVEYFNLKTKKKTFFEKNDLRIKGINCI